MVDADVYSVRGASDKEETVPFVLIYAVLFVEFQLSEI